MYKDSTCMVGSGILNMELPDTKEERRGSEGEGRLELHECCQNEAIPIGLSLKHCYCQSLLGDSKRIWTQSSCDFL